MSPETNKQPNCVKFVGQTDHKLTSLDPIQVYNNRLLSSRNRNLLEPIEMFVFYTNNHYILDPTFKLDFMPNLMHLETNDDLFCQFLINDSREREFVCPSVKHLVLAGSFVDVLIESFPNVEYVELNDLGLKFDDEVAEDYLGADWSHLKVDNDEMSDAFIDFLTGCKRLQHLEFKLPNESKEEQLERILSELVWIRELVLFVDGPMEGIERALNAHLDRFADTNFKLTINFVIVQANLRHLEPLIEFENSKAINNATFGQIERDQRTNLDLDLFYNRIRHVRIGTNREIDQLLNHNSKLECLLAVNFMDLPPSSELIDLKRVLDVLPKRMKCLVFHLPHHSVSNELLNTLPDRFPNLIKLLLETLGKRVLDLRFVSEFNYLSDLILIEISYKNHQHLITILKRCKYLSYLVIKNRWKAGKEFTKFKPQLLRQIKSKKKEIRPFEFVFDCD